MMARMMRATGWALVLGVLALAPASPAAAKKARPPSGGPKVSQNFREAMTRAQLAASSGNPGMLRQQLNVASSAAQSADEKYFVGALRYKQADAANDRMEMRKGANEMLLSGSAQLADAAQTALLAGGLAYETNDPGEAIARMAQADQLGSKDVARFLVSAESLARLRRPAEALVMFEKALGQPGVSPKDSWYLRAMSLANAAKQPADIARWGAALIRDFPSPENCRIAAFTYRDGSKLDGIDLLDLSRLVVDAKGLAGERDVLEFANVGLTNGAGGEAKRAIEQGYASVYISKVSPAAKTSLASATSKAMAERGAASGGEKAAFASSDGKGALAVANAWLASGESEKAVSFYRLALNKGKVDANQVNLRLGIALNRAGRNADAATAFAAVTGARKPIADLWAAFAR
ncbi:MAG: hypothetical protein RL367_441 [Pseudomonadota bacterium]